MREITKKMLRNTIFVCGLLAFAKVKSTFGFVRPGVGGSHRGSADTSLNQPLTSGNASEISGNESSGFAAENNSRPVQLHPNTLSEVITCPRVDNRVRTVDGETCPRGWSKAPKCSQPDLSNIGDVCERNETSKYQLPKTVATLRAVLCRPRRIKCLGQIGVIPGDTQLLYVPRSPQSDKSELAEALSNLKELVVVDFSRNDFRYLSSKTFHGNMCLRSVNFDLNFLLDIPEDIFFRSKDLTSVSFVGNKLDYLPPQLFRYNRRLTIADFTRNNITYLPPEIFRQNRRLEVIRLTGNAIPELPSGLFSSNYLLREIALSRNRMAAVPKMLFGSARNLRDVRLSSNRIQSLPETIFANCRELQVVALDWNMLRTLPARLFDRNPKLSHVNLSYNRFHVVSRELFANNPLVTVVYDQWKDRKGVLEEENHGGGWRPMPRLPSPLPYRKSISNPKWP